MAARSGNPSPVPARLARRNRSARGDVDKLRALVWRVVVKLEAAIKKAPDVDPDTLKICNSLAQIAPVFLKCVEVGELEARITLLEGQHQDEAQHQDAAA